jgi:hypothetical protein
MKEPTNLTMRKAFKEQAMALARERGLSLSGLVEDLLREEFSCDALRQSLRADRQQTKPPRKRK